MSLHLSPHTKVFFFLIIPLFILPTTTTAQAVGIAGPHSFSLSLGQVWSAGDVSRDAGSTVGGGVVYEYAASDVFSMQAGAFRSEHQEHLGLLSTTLSVKANLIYYDQLVPYAFFGAGFYFASAPPEGENKINSTHFGIKLGVGADLELNHTFFLGALLSIDNLFSDRAKAPNGQEMRLTGRFSSILVRFGFRL